MQQCGARRRARSSCRRPRAAGSLAFLALPTLWLGSLLNTADNAFSYSINQSAKEALYVPTTEDEKYKAKAFIDMFVQRCRQGGGRRRQPRR